MKMISVLTPCYNEQANVREVYERVKAAFERLNDYSYEHVFIDNASTDNTVGLLKEIARQDRRVKIIVNARNFGHIRSPFHGLLQTKGDAVISLVADLQDPPELIPDFIRKWEAGYKIVLGVKTKSEESPIFFAVRRAYYSVINRLSEIPLVKNATGFGLFDREVVEILRGIDDPYPYFRGLICDIGFDRAEIIYTQPARKRGFTKSNFYSLYDMAMLGITNHSKVPLRLATLAGFCLGAISLLIAVAYLVYKLLFWSSFQLGMAPLVIGIFFFAAVQLFFIGILGEYVGAIHTQVLRRPRVIEKERINFD